ncbi:OmpA/MotB:Rickettsia 17 kDa surface antigen [Pedobacter sp. BAL39]|uniref:OmpA family protein n=1 Tax=Pedobacter sp. BAL39 TaxID=391596 RepID=UPI0001559A2E|nr:OmpA family protein [Pedobacter sp. BAL39]EDM35792.1 OmpA/MotB:Rickettsia 17 kDa surface antigen [Pedobacter sp. BAL39]
MTHKINLLLALLLSLTVACKTQKIAKSTTPPATEVAADQELDNLKKNLPDNQIARTNEGIKFTFSSEVLFPTNSSILNEASKKKLAEVAKVISEQKPAPAVLIEGHSDKTGTAPYNQWLSEKRAVSVKTYLVSLGIAASKIRTAGQGDTKPVGDNKTKEGRLQNRRVEITLLKSN